MPWYTSKDVWLRASASESAHAFVSLHLPRGIHPIRENGFSETTPKCHRADHRMPPEMAQVCSIRLILLYMFRGDAMLTMGPWKRRNMYYAPPDINFVVMAKALFDFSAQCQRVLISNALGHWVRIYVKFNKWLFIVVCFPQIKK